MSQQIDKKEYLKKYMSGPMKDDKKKKKKNPKVLGNSMKIIDDDVDLSKMRSLENEELFLLGDTDEAPVVVGIVDERPEHIRLAEQYGRDKWKVITEDDGFNSKITVQQVTKKAPKLVEGEGNDSDLSPVRVQSGRYDSDLSPERPSKMTSVDSSNRSSPGRDGQKRKRKKHSPDRDIDTKVDRIKGNCKRKDSNSDLSPVRAGGEKTDKNDESDSDMSPVRDHRKNTNISHRIKQEHSDSDLSPQRDSKKRTDKKNNHDKDNRQRSNYKRESDPSPKQDGKKDSRRRRKDSSDSDLSVERRREKSGSKRNDCGDSDLSPDRNTKTKVKRERSSSPLKNVKRKGVDVRRSPLRDRRRDGRKERKASRWGDVNDRVEIEVTEGGSRRRSHSRERQNQDERYRDGQGRDFKGGRENDRSRSDSGFNGSKKMERTLDGKRAGLQDARHLKEETEEFRRRETELFGKLSEEHTGRNAKAIKRNLSGKKETEEDKQVQREKEAKQRAMEAKYNEWGKGLKQVSQQQDRVQEYLHEAAKPLARHRDDADLEAILRRKERDGDPMLEYVKRKEKERGEVSGGQPVRPTYNGPFPPNRYDIRPGHRWDGVDRSNGHERNYFEAKSKRIAIETDKYKWSTEDM